jgi:hypothetical protein
MRLASYRVIITLPLLVTLLLAGCDRKETQTTAASPAPNWIQEATAISVRIPTDLHAVEHDRCLAQTAAVALELGLTEQIDPIANLITSWHKAEIYARLAGIRYQAADKKAGDALIAKARAALRADTYEDWQVSRVHAAIEQARHLKGEQTDAALLDRIDPADQARLLPSMISESVAATNFNALLSRLEATTNAVLDIDQASGAADSYHALYTHAPAEVTDSDFRIRIENGLTHTLKQLPAPMACDKLLNLCETALHVQDADFVTRLCVLLDQQIPAIRADLRIPVLLRYADLRVKQGEPGRAVAQLEQVEAHLDDPSVLFSDKPVLLARCALLYGTLGDTAKRDAVLAGALTQLNAFKNARPRAMAAVAFCHVCARANLDNPAVFEAVQKLRKELDDPW